MTRLQYFTYFNSYFGSPYQDWAQESMSYNVNGQLASLGWIPSYFGTFSGASTGVQYNYSGTQNNGQITSVSDTLSGETISYTYDVLKRLTLASSTPISGSTPAAWTQSYQSDGFGNLTGSELLLRQRDHHGEPDAVTALGFESERLDFAIPVV